MRKFVKVALIVCLSIAAVPAVLFGCLWLWVWYKTAQVESFYQEHRLLREMRTAQHGSTNNSGPARDALLRIVPLGTNRETAESLLRNEGLGCHTIAEPITDTRLRRRFVEARSLTDIPHDNSTRKQWVDCQRTSPNLMGYQHWIVDLEFDAEEHLSDAGIAVWNIFL
ncbi:hypothetical protein ACFQZO_13275 [Bradyrhizobium sp. GCM10027634]|uniref:hypothetical protein n=1 Tax=unclassified Bradyrhizobium TaxID=2631580 RepID=UPI00188D0BB6|nr:MULTISPECIES: hypothetical protein [unclassified Bradyrhizobium]MDN5001859.1 hypothetical protein [Bradyrhizobium sp. WYCCWR 12677]QOZ45842.1 hypothetical protein XH89_21950 [Bradyrhizobium sp. CCBAU 53340]